jgi:hypothetical protein
MDKRFDELDKKARWKWGSVVVPLAVSIFPHSSHWLQQRLALDVIHKVSTPAELGRVLAGSLRLSKCQYFSNLLK